MTKFRLLGFIGLATIGVTAACGNSSEPSGMGRSNPAMAESAAAKPSGGMNLASVRKDPCQMVTKPEAEAIFGRPAEMPTKGMVVGVVEATCDYAVETTRPSEVRTMTVSIMFSPDRVERGMDGKKFMENARKGAIEMGMAVEGVGGLGDEAFCLEGKPGDSLFLRTGDVVMTVGGNVDDCAVARQFAEKAITRL